MQRDTIVKNFCKITVENTRQDTHKIREPFFLSQTIIKPNFSEKNLRYFSFRKGLSAKKPKRRPFKFAKRFFQAKNFSKSEVVPFDQMK